MPSTPELPTDKGPRAARLTRRGALSTLGCAFAMPGCISAPGGQTSTPGATTTAADVAMPNDGSGFLFGEPAKRVPTLVGSLAVVDLAASSTSPSSRTLVLWPSILADSSMYLHQVEAWRKQHRVVLIDGPGHGASGGAGRIFSMVDCAVAMGQILDARGIATPVVPVGTSWGGLVGGEFALLYPARTDGLVMLNTPIFTSAQGPGFADRFVVWGARWIHATTLYADGVARAFFLPATRQRGGPVLEHFHRHLRQADGDALAQAVRSVLIERTALAPRLAGIPAPALFVAGTMDQMYPVAELRKAVEGMRRGRFAELPTAHISAVDEPQAVAGLVADFLRTLS